jgi:hypothetical protein
MLHNAPDCGTIGAVTTGGLPPTPPPPLPPPPARGGLVTGVLGAAGTTTGLGFDILRTTKGFLGSNVSQKERYLLVSSNGVLRS